VTAGMDESEGNYYWTGSPPVGYDVDGIPIDANGRQCIDISCPLHPGFEPKELEFNEVLQSDIPTLDSFRGWFEDNFLEISDAKLKRYIFKWWVRKNKTRSVTYNQVLLKFKSVNEIIGAIWQHEEQIS
jgi:hypothetical protein